MEKSEVSRHEVAVFKCLIDARGWVTSKEIHERANVHPRTARAHAAKLVKLGIADLAEVFPAHRYRISNFAAKRNKTYSDRLLRAAEVFGINLVLPE